MKKMIYLMLFLIVLGAASMTAQVTIGSTESPDPAAVLDLQSTDLGLLIPRINLTDDADKSALATKNVKGMVVYNTGTGGDGVGIYYNDGSNWTKISSGVTSVTGSSGITVTNGTSDAPEIALTPGTAAGQYLKFNGESWTPEAVEPGLVEITGTLGITAAIDPDGNHTLGITPGTDTAQMLGWDGTTWKPMHTEIYDTPVSVPALPALGTAWLTCSGCAGAYSCTINHILLSSHFRGSSYIDVLAVGAVAAHQSSFSCMKLAF